MWESDFRDQSKMLEPDFFGHLLGRVFCCLDLCLCLDFSLIPFHFVMMMMMMMMMMMVVVVVLLVHSGRSVAAVELVACLFPFLVLDLDPSHCFDETVHCCCRNVCFDHPSDNGICFDPVTDFAIYRSGGLCPQPHCDEEPCRFP